MTTPFLKKRGFTIVEVMICIFIIGILTVATAYGYGALSHSVVDKEAKNDLQQVIASMKSSRNWSDSGSYPTAIPSSFESSNDIDVEYAIGDSSGYCISATGKTFSDIIYHVDTRSQGNEQIESGKC
jgi:prepilin-type N-terminal cleavage/methylation domain-containing protein